MSNVLSITDQSCNMPPSCSSSHTHLLTDNWEDVTDDTVPMLSKPTWNLGAFKSIIKQSLSNWYSEEGYSTDHSDHTLDSYQLPFTALTGRKDKRRKLSVASDSTDCTICGYIKSNPSTRSHSVFSKLQENDRIVEERDGNVRDVSNITDAWHDSSDSYDSAFPRESVSSSSAATPVMYDYISDDGHVPPSL